MLETKVINVDAALKYIGLGIPVFPCKPRSKQPATEHGYKDATTDKEQIIEWFEDSDYNIGIPTGRVSGIIVLDVDPKHGGNESLEEWKPVIPDGAPEVTTPSGGKHYYFRYPDNVEIRNSAGTIAKGLDMRGNGGYVVAPPSEAMVEVYKHGEKAKSPHPYRGTVELTSLGDLPEIPEELLKAIQTASEGRRSACVDFDKGLIPVGERNNTLTSYGGKFRSLGMNHEAIQQTLHNINEAQCETPLDSDEVDRIAESVSRYERGMLKIEEVSDDREEIGTALDTVEPEKVEWLWEKRIPFGKITVLDGDPGLGKSCITLDIAAKVTTGELGDVGDVEEDSAYLKEKEVRQEDRHVRNTGELGGVVLLSAEDGLADTIVPRLNAAGADTSRIRHLCMLPDDDGKDRVLRIPQDLDKVEKCIEQVGAKLLVIDPIMAFLSGDTHKDSEVRKSLAPLTNLAERTGVAILLVRHMNKGEATKAIYRGGGSIGIIGNARSGLAVEEHPDDKNLCILAPTKNNLSKKPVSLVYSVETVEDVAKVEWHGETHYSANDILTEQGSESSRAEKWLEDELSLGRVESKEIYARAEKQGIAPRTLERAKKSLGIQSKRDGKESFWQHRQDNKNGEDGGFDGELENPLPITFTGQGRQHRQHRQPVER